MNRETWATFGRHDVRIRLQVADLVTVDGFGFARVSPKGSAALDEHEKTQRQTRGC